MRIFLLAIGARDRASSRLRVWDHVDWLREQGHDVRVDSLVPVGAKRMTPRLAARIARRLPGWIAAFWRSDAVVLQETLLLWPLLLVKDLGRQRRVMFDFSDPVDRIGDGLKGQLRRRMFDLLVRRADVVMVENGAYLDLLRDRARGLAQFYGPVDAARYARARTFGAVGADDSGQSAIRPAIRIGWTGSPATYPFIQSLMPVIDDLARDHPIEVALVGAGPVDPQFRHATLTLIEWNEDSEFSVVPSFDLGLFRLDDSEDALWRGAGKLFIYMAAGVPFVANDRGIARHLMDETGTGFRVANDGDWKSVLRDAISDPAERQRMTERSLDVASSTLSYDAYRRKLMAGLALAA